MKQESLTDMMSDELLAKLIDDTLHFKKTEPNRHTKALLFKIIPAAAMIALAIGLLNILPYISKTTPGSDPNAGVATQTEFAPPQKVVDQSGLFLPEAIEKTFFEEKIMALITDQRAVNKISIYYCFFNGVYVLDPNTSVREQNEMIEYLREYTDLTGYDMYQMCVDNGIALPKKVDPAYAHVRFGATENILLLDIEWHTYETYVKERLEPEKKRYDEYRASLDEFMEISDEEKEKIYKRLLENIESYEIYADKIKNEVLCASRTINGKSDEIRGGLSMSPSEKSKYFDSNGYFVYEVFPQDYWVVGYIDKNYQYNSEIFAYGKDKFGNPIGINSQSEYEYLLKNEIIPFCDDLLAKGLINQAQYDMYTPPNLLDYYIDQFFN